MRPFNDNNVYILGAGFSADAGLPVISNFLARMRDAVDWLESGGRVAEREAIERVLDFRHQSAAAGYRVNLDLDNIENLFSLADARLGSTSSEDIRLAIAATLDFCALTATKQVGLLRVRESQGWPCTQSFRSNARRISEVPDQGIEEFESSIYDYFAAFMAGLASNKIGAGKNTIISLNYDLLIEEALRRLDIPFSYGITGPGVEIDGSAGVAEHAPNACPILKLHGSINWAQTNGGMVVLRDYEQVRDGQQSPFLIPPTWRKAATDPLLAVWNAAVSAITKATRLVLVGFSIPPADQHFKYLIGAGLKENSSLRSVHSVDPRALMLLDQYKGVFREDQFTYGVVRMQPMTAAQFFYHQDEIGSIGREIAHPGLEYARGPGGMVRRAT